jgi:hypothetical protein
LRKEATGVLLVASTMTFAAETTSWLMTLCQVARTGRSELRGAAVFMRLPQLSTTERRCGTWIGFEVDAVGITDLLGEGVRDDLWSLP